MILPPSNCGGWVSPSRRDSARPLGGRRRAIFGKKTGGGEDPTARHFRPYVFYLAFVSVPWIEGRLPLLSRPVKMFTAEPTDAVFL
jgi:hypothetical protein